MVLDVNLQVRALTATQLEFEVLCARRLTEQAVRQPCRTATYTFRSVVTRTGAWQAAGLSVEPTRQFSSSNRPRA